ncbi:MAG: hypothetical protein HY900_36925, partial [Deltaproteobacteria bacterium]|nr:hypothetical protein [Deltaproteobacteria bacterium]
MDRAGKLFPPYLDGAQLRRQRLLGYVRQQGGGGRRALFIEAQAGQGKSVFAAQLAEELGVDYCWYQLGPEDGDTLSFISCLLAGLTARIPGFRAPLLERMLVSGAVSAGDHQRLCSVLLSDLKSSLTRDFRLVFDDVYLLDGFPESLAFLRGLLEGAPPRLRFILTSRHPIAPVVRAMLPPADSFLVDNATLSFNRHEIAELFNGVLHIPVSQRSVQLLYRVTEGWALGLVLAGQSLPEGAEGGEDGLAHELEAVTRDSVLGYFVAQIFPRLPVGRRRSLLSLALLESIPIRLAEMLAEAPDARELLSDLHGRNFFVRPLDGDRTEFVFHHLFRESLRALALQRLSPEEIRSVHCRAARWYLEHERPLEALGCYFDAGEFAAADTLLKGVGFELQAHNRIVTLHQALTRIPEDAVRQYGWLSYFAGITILNVDPPKALSHLEEARGRFVRAADDMGELFALLQLVAFHAVVDGRYHLGSMYLERAAALFEGQSGKLAALHRARAANVFLMGFTVIRNDIRRADAYFDVGLKIAQELGLKNLEAEARLWRCYRHLFAGSPAHDVLAEIEKAYPLIASPLVAPLNKAALYLAFVNAQVNLGEHDAFTYHRVRLRRLVGEDLVDRSVLRAFLRMWDVDISLARGDRERAREVLGRALAADFTGGGAHLRSQFLQYDSLVLAEEGRVAEALAAVEESRRLRAETGSRYFAAVNSLFTGAALARAGKADEALEAFGQGLQIMDDMREAYGRAGLHAHRARLCLETGQSEQARKDIGECLDLLHRNRHAYFYGWSPELMERILSAAVREGIRPAFARELARRRLGLEILPDGSVLPLLEITSLGLLEIRLGPRVVLRGSSLTPAQRQLLAVLLSSPGLQCGQEEIAALLWPESPEENARKSFDALLIRLRRAFQEASGGEIDGRRYLSLRKGVLALEHCRVDALGFRARATKGLGHLRRREYWQADNAFRSAFALWEGEFLAGMILPDPAETLRQELTVLYLDCARRWSGLLASDGRQEEACRTAEAALRLDPINEELVRILY